MNLHNMRLEVYLTPKHHEPRLKTLGRTTWEMLRLKVFPEVFVVDKVPRLGVQQSTPRVDAVTDMAAFMFFAGVEVEFVSGVEGLVAEFAFGVACETSQGDVFDGVAGYEVGV